MEQNINDLEQLREISQKFTKTFKYPQLVLLYGDLGSGKSQTVRFMTEALGVAQEMVNSPAYNIIHSYSFSKGEISHIDLYRLKDAEDLESTGFWDVFSTSSLVFIEWADLLKAPLPSSWSRLSLFFKWSEGKRSLKWEWKDKNISL